MPGLFPEMLLTSALAPVSQWTHKPNCRCQSCTSFQEGLGGGENRGETLGAQGATVSKETGGTTGPAYFRRRLTWRLCQKCYARCPNPREGREKGSETMQLAKREVYCYSSQRSCRIQRSGAGSESPEPKLLHKFIG